MTPPPLPLSAQLPDRGRHPAIVRWTDDWNRWTDSPAARAAVTRWRNASTLIRPLTTVAGIVDGTGADRTVPDSLANRRLLFLVTQATAGDGDAARVVIARIQPGLIALATRRSGWGQGQFGALFDDYLGAAWLTVVGYPVDRRPGKVAANLLYDVEGHIHGRPGAIDQRTHLRPPGALPHGHARLDGRPADAPTDALLTVLRLLADGRNAGLSARSLRLLADLGVHGHHPHTLATGCGVADRTIRWRRDRAVRELRRRLDLDLPTGRPRHPRTTATAAAYGRCAA